MNPEKIPQTKIDSTKKEKESTEEQILRAFLELAKTKHGQRDKMNVDALVAKIKPDLPKELQAEVTRDVARLRGYKELSKENLKRETEIAIRKIENSYIEKKLKMPNAVFSRMECMQAIDHLLSSESGPTLEDLKKVARISFDLNGLKAVNDLNGGDHSRGDRYLELTRDAINDPEIKKWAKDHGIRYVASRDGGDEFGVILISSEPLTHELISEFTKQTKNKLLENKDVGKLLDFEKDEEVVRRFCHISKEDWPKKSDSDREEKIAQLREDNGIPKGYKFQGAIAGDGATLYDALLDDKNYENKENAITEQDTYGRMLQKLMGFMFGTADRGMDEDKARYKTALKESGDEKERMLYQVYTRSAEEGKLARETQKLKEQLEQLNQKLERLERENEKLRGKNKKLRKKFQKSKEEEQKLKKKLKKLEKAEKKKRKKKTKKK